MPEEHHLIVLSRHKHRQGYKLKVALSLRHNAELHAPFPVRQTPCEHQIEACVSVAHGGTEQTLRTVGWPFTTLTSLLPPNHLHVIRKPRRGQQCEEEVDATSAIFGELKLRIRSLEATTL